MRFGKWLALFLCLCVMVSSASISFAEEIVIESGEQDLEEDGTQAGVELLEDGTDLLEISDAAPDLETPDGEDSSSSSRTDAGEAQEETGVDYAKVVKAGSPVYLDASADSTIAELAKGEVVLVIDGSGKLARVAFNVSGTLVKGYMKPSRIKVMSHSKVSAYQKRVTGLDHLVLYRDDLDLVLGPIGAKSRINQLVSNAKNYKEYDNNTPYVLNGVTIRAGDEPTKGAHNCWKWAQAIYKKVWGCSFDSTFEGTASRGHNLVRKLSDNERALTPENLKYMVMNAKPGATLRVQSCPSSCSGFNTDGCGKHEKHSLIIAEIRSDGLVTMDDQGTVPHTRFYTWQGFCDSWKRWKYVKYIKWPNAPALASMNSVDGYSVSDHSETYRVRADAARGTGVFSLPENGKVVEKLSYPATFKASKITLKEIGGYSWVYGESSTGTKGWLALTESVASSTQSIEVTGVSISQKSAMLLKGGTLTLHAAIAPIDATNQNVTWSSDNADVVSVSGGVITGTGAGTASVTVTTADGSKRASCSVIVFDADAGKSLGKTGNNGTVKLAAGKKLQLIPTFAIRKGWKIKSIKSSKKAVASVSGSGLVTARKAGTAKITVKTKNGKTATITVKVAKSASSPSVPTTVSTEPETISFAVKGTVSMKARTTRKLQTVIYPTTASTTALTWKSSKPGVVYVDQEGNIYALKKGTCYIGVMTANGKFAKIKIKVV